jgi:DNA polymerase-3 subunit delta'
VLVLVSDRPALLIATIRSRCQRVEARFPAREVALAWLGAQGIAPDAAASALALAAGNPGIALGFARPEALALAEEVARDLERIAQRATGAEEVALRWAKDRPAERLELAGELARSAAWSAAGVPAADARLARLTTRTDLFKLAAWWDRLNGVRAQVSTPLRTDLLLFEVLDEFRDLAA